MEKELSHYAGGLVLDAGTGRTDGGSPLAARPGGPHTEHARPVSNLMDSQATASTPEALRVRDQARLECASVQHQAQHQRASVRLQARQCAKVTHRLGRNPRCGTNIDPNIQASVASVSMPKRAQQVSQRRALHQGTVKSALYFTEVLQGGKGASGGAKYFTEALLGGKEAKSV